MILATLPRPQSFRKKSPLACALLLGLLLLAANPAKADQNAHWQAVAEQTVSQNWAKVADLGEKTPYPVIKKLSMWLYITHTPLPVSFQTLSAFMLKNPEWPVPMSIVEKTESKMPEGLRPYTVIEWFDKHSPRTAHGLDLYLRALRQMGYTEQVEKVLETRWEKIRLSEKDLKIFIKDHKTLLTNADHYNRVDYLIWNDRVGEAEDVLPYLDGDLRTLAEARLALASNKPGATTTLNRVPKELLNDSALLYERLRWRRRHNLDVQAFELLSAQPAHLTNPAKWWQERHILARRALEKGEYELAYRITARHHLIEGFEFSQAEWLLGWLDLRFLKKPDDAYRHFTLLFDKVKFPVSKSRAAYWLGRACDELKRPEEAQDWYQKAAAYPTTFYGQLARQTLPDTFVPPASSPPDIDVLSEKEFNADSRVEAIRLLAKAKMREEARPLFDALVAEADTPADYALIAQLSKSAKMNQYAVQAGKNLSQSFGIALMDEGYPIPPLPASAANNKSLIYAIIRQESLFDEKAESPAGARGLMQLMPTTAKNIAKRLKIPFSAGRLTSDPDYNMTIGSAYFQHLLDEYDGSLVLSIATYNAGPSNVGEWIDLFGDPRDPKTDIIDWIEIIPFYETRNYVQRVLENSYVYQERLGQKARLELK